MLKQIIALVILSVTIIFSMPYAQQALQLLIHAHTWISTLLADVFSGGQAGKLVKGLIALLSIPVLTALIPTLCYWVLKRRFFPYFMHIVWIIWLIQAGALIAIYKVL